MSRDGFLVLYAALQLGVVGVMGAIAWLIHRLPPSMINMPNRMYWLTEERRPATLETNRTVLWLIAGLTALFLTGVFQLTLHANLQAVPRLDAAWFTALLVAYLVLIGAVMVWLYIRFGRIPAGDR
jgi:hypothetical protein